VEHKDHVNLLRRGVPGPGGIWADLGSGAGAFTLALAELIGPAGQIHSVDRDRRPLREQERLMRSHYAGDTRSLARAASDSIRSKSRRANGSR
jgi:precorrin-6B methylase 2